MSSTQTKTKAIDASVRKMAAIHPSSKTRAAIQRLLQRIYYTTPDIEVVRIDPLIPSPHTAYILTTRENHHFMLKTPPPAGLRLMRHESKNPAEEQQILLCLKQTHIPKPMIVSCDDGPGNALGAPYMLRSYVPGTPLSAIAHRMTSFDLAQVETSVGMYMRHATFYKQNRFGISAKVLAGNGHRTWREAFHSLLEAALRDAEDAVLNLPFDSIRHWVGVHLHRLDIVREAHLVPLRTGTHQTVIIDETSKTVVGLIGWGDVVWGDIALGEAFDNPSSSFWNGFNASGGKSLLRYNDGSDEIRHRVYSVYRSIVSIVRYSFRPRMGVDTMDSMRQMNMLLCQLKDDAE